MLNAVGFIHQKRDLYRLKSEIKTRCSVFLWWEHPAPFTAVSAVYCVTIRQEIRPLCSTKPRAPDSSLHVSQLCSQGSVRILLDYKLFSCAGTQPEICYSSDQPAGSADSDLESPNSCGTQLMLLKYWKGFPSSSRECLRTLQMADTRYCIPTRWQGLLIILKQMKTPGFPKRLRHMCILQAQQLLSSCGASSHSCQISKHGEVGPGLRTVDTSTYNIRALKKALCSGLGTSVCSQPFCKALQSH